MVPKSAELASEVVASLGTILTGELVLSLRKKKKTVKLEFSCRSCNVLF